MVSAHTILRHAWLVVPGAVFTRRLFFVTVRDYPDVLRVYAAPPAHDNLQDSQDASRHLKISLFITYRSLAYHTPTFGSISTTNLHISRLAISRPHLKTRTHLRLDFSIFSTLLGYYLAYDHSASSRRHLQQDLSDLPRSLDNPDHVFS